MKKTPSADLSFTTTEQIKGFAIIMILLCHLATHLLWLANNNDPFAYWGQYGVEIFLFLSGFGLTKSYLKKGMDNFWIFRHFLRVWIPYVLVTSIWLLCDYYLLRIHHSMSDSIPILAGIILPYNVRTMVDTNTWYITYILTEYLIFYFVFKRKKLLNVQKFCLFLFLSAVVLIGHEFFLLHILKYAPGSFSGWQDFTFISICMGVFVGLWEKEMSTIMNRYKPSQKQTILLVGICMSLIFSFFLQEQSIFGGIFFVLLFLFFSFKGFGSRFLSFIGMISFELYLIHGPLLIRYDFIFFHAPLFITFPIYFGVICLLAYLLHQAMNMLIPKINTILRING